MSHRTLALLAIVVAAMVATPAMCVFGCDETEAAPTDVDCTRYYYDQMNDIEKMMYDGAAALQPDQTSFTVSPDMGIFGTTSKTEIDAALSSALDRVQNAMMTEQPQLYWIGNNMGYTVHYTLSGGNVTSVTLDVSFSEGHASDAASKSALDAAVDSYTIDTSSRYSAVKSIHNLIDGTVTYSSNASDYGPRSAYTALLGSHEVVCEGYAKSFKLLCDHYGIPCISVTGNAKGYASDEPQGHMWNYVQMENGKWYFVDCTWDDQSTLRDTYLLAGSGSVGLMFSATEPALTISQSHVPDTKYTLPVLDTAAFSPEGYVTVDLVYDGYGPTLVGKGTTFEMPALVSAGHEFDGWNTAADGTGTMYSAGSSYGFDSDITLYPIWHDVYMLYFTVNGEVIKTVMYTSASDTVTAPAVPDRAGYTDGHWESYSLSPLGNKTVNAVYTPIHYKATFVAEGVKIAEVDFTMDDRTLAEPEIPQKDGYRASWEKYTIGPSDMTINAEYSEDGNLLDSVFDAVEKVDPQYVSIGALVLGIIVAIAAVAKGRH